MRSVSPSPPTLSAYQTVNWLSVDSSWAIHYCIHSIHFTNWTLINTFGATVGYHTQLFTTQHVPDYSYSSQVCLQTVTKTSWQCRVGGDWCPQLPRAVLAQMTRGAATHLLLLAVTDQNVNIRRGGEQRTQLKWVVLWLWHVCVVVSAASGQRERAIPVYKVWLNSILTEWFSMGIEDHNPGRGQRCIDSKMSRGGADL